MMKCPNCNDGKLAKVAADEPWHDEHLQCGTCDSTYAIYDKDGNLHNAKAAQIGRLLAEITSSVYLTLFEEGMTNLEAKALADYLTCEVHTAAFMAMLKKQAKSAKG